VHDALSWSFSADALIDCYAGLFPGVEAEPIATASERRVT
jgi:hypothetical protein